MLVSKLPGGPNANHHRSKVMTGVCRICIGHVCFMLFVSLFFVVEYPTVPNSW